MKKLFITMCMVLTSICGFAQSKGITWEANVGMNIAKQTNSSSLTAFHAGIRCKISDSDEQVYINAGVLLSFKGCSFDMGVLGKSTVHANYLEFPIHLGYQHAINDNLSLFGEFGPYFAYGLFGKTKATYLDYSGNGNLTYNTFDALKRFDFGLGIRVGAELRQKYILAIGYDYGLINCYKEIDDDSDTTGSSLKNRNLYISLGYKF